MILWLVLSLSFGQAQRPGAPVGTTVSSGEDTYITWTVDLPSTGMVYDISLDDGPWEPLRSADLKEMAQPSAASAKSRVYLVNRGKLAPGQHTARLRECVSDRTACAASAVVSVTVLPPAACQMGPWAPWSEWTEWGRSGAIEIRRRSHYRVITTFPGQGAEPCPPNAETVQETRPYVAPTPVPVSVAYVRMDGTSRGAWKGVYGSAGQVFAGVKGQALSFVTVTPQAAEVWTWVARTTDDRGLQRPGTAAPTDRVAAAWYGDQFELDVNFRDALVHEVALYAVDWDGLGRAQTIAVVDTLGAVQHTVTTGPELRTGVYYVWRISGHVRIRVTRTGGANAVVFGLLFGPAAP